MSNIVDKLRSDITEAASLLGEGWEVADDRELAGPGDMRVYCRVDNGGYLHPDRARYEVNAGYSHLADDLYVYQNPRRFSATCAAKRGAQGIAQAVRSILRAGYPDELEQMQKWVKAITLKRSEDEGTRDMLMVTASALDPYCGHGTEFRWYVSGGTSGTARISGSVSLELNSLSPELANAVLSVIAEHGSDG